MHPDKNVDRASFHEEPEDSTQNVDSHKKKHPLKIFILLSVGVFLLLGIFFANERRLSKVENQPINSEKVDSSDTISPNDLSYVPLSKDVNYYPSPRKIQLETLAIIDECFPYRVSSYGRFLPESTYYYSDKAEYYEIGTMKLEPSTKVVIAFVRDMPRVSYSKITTAVYAEDNIFDLIFTISNNGGIVFYQNGNANDVLPKWDEYEGRWGSEIYDEWDRYFRVIDDEEYVLQCSPDSPQIIVKQKNLDIDFFANAEDSFKENEIKLAKENLIGHATDEFYKKLSVIQSFDSGFDLLTNQDYSQGTVSLGELLLPEIYIKSPFGFISAIHTTENLNYSLDSSDSLTGNNISQWNSGTSPNFDYLDNLKKLNAPELERLNYYYEGNSVWYTSSFGYGSCFDAQVIMSSYQATGRLGDIKKLLDSEAIQLDSDLIKVGETKSGKEVYEIFNADNPIYSLIWESFTSKKFSSYLDYETYLDLHPFLVIKDERGIYSLLFRTDLMFSCDAEPLIYIYSEKERDITIRLPEIVDVTASSPTYSDIWKVKVDSLGEIYDYSSKENFDTLFWEGMVPLPLLPDRVQSVRTTELSQFFDVELRRFGLTHKEIDDFKAYWLKKMNAEDMYLVSFYGTKKLEETIPLDIEPSPEVLIRVLMDYRPYKSEVGIDYLDSKFKVNPRKDFTVVEWSGIKHSEFE